MRFALFSVLALIGLMSRPSYGQPGPEVPATEAAEFATPPSDLLTVSTVPAHIQIAVAYGLDQTHTVEAMRFVFHVKEGLSHIRRGWEWDLSRNAVTYRGPDLNGNIVEHTYGRDRIGDGNAELNKYVDGWFVHDQYWLLFPFHLAWDRDVKVDDEGERPLPIAPGTARRLTASFPEAGSLPGRVYEIYYSPTYMIKEWTCRNRSAEPRALTTTWSNHAKAGPLIVSLSREGADGNLRVTFEDVAVKTVDGTWHPAVLLDRFSSRVQAWAGEGTKN